MGVDEVGRYSPSANVVAISPEDYVYAQMRDGWINQQRARGLKELTIKGRLAVLDRFTDSAGKYPWHWNSGDADHFFGDLVAVRRAALGTIRGYQNGLKQFADYVNDERYGWPQECLRLFGTYPVQVFFEWNTASHTQDFEGGPGRRPFSLVEIETFFDYADDEVQRVSSSGHKGTFAAYRDATVFKVAYAWGLRLNEVRNLEITDWSRNPQVPEFGPFGAVRVRFGKANRGAAPKQRTVFTTWPWSHAIVVDWLRVLRIQYGDSLPRYMFPTERGTPVSKTQIGERFREYRDALAMDGGLKFHCFRHSYVSHAIEAGVDPKFVQDNVGHEHASTTSLYTGVSSDYRVRTVRNALDARLFDAMTREIGEYR